MKTSISMLLMALGMNAMAQVDFEAQEFIYQVKKPDGSVKEIVFDLLSPKDDLVESIDYQSYLDDHKIDRKLFYNDIIISSFITNALDEGLAFVNPESIKAIIGDKPVISVFPKDYEEDLDLRNRMTIIIPIENQHTNTGLPIGDIFILGKLTSLLNR